MLSQLLHLLEHNQGELDLAAISRQLQAQPSAVAGMVEMLLRKGRLVEVGPACGVCETCGVRSQCNLPEKRAKKYVVVNRRPVAVPKS